MATITKTVGEEFNALLEGFKADLEGLGITPDTIQRDIRNQPVAEALDTSVSPREDLGFIDLGDNELLDKASDVALQLLSGEVPDDVKTNIERFTAEMATQGGLGLSQAASNLTARDLGITSLAMKQSGSELATKVGELKDRRRIVEEQINVDIAKANEASRMKWTELELAHNKWLDTFSLQSGALELDEQKLDLATYTLMSQNMLTIGKLMTDMIIADSREEIKTLQSNIDTLRLSITESERGEKGFGGLNDRLMELLGLTP